MILINIRKRVYQLLESTNPDDRSSRRLDSFIIGLIALNVIAIILESVQDLRLQYGIIFFWFEAFSVLVFSIEYVLRIWSCVEHSSGKYIDPVLGRLRFSFTPMALVDIVAIIPFYLSMFFAIDLRFLRTLRLLRIFKLTRYSSAISMLLKVLQDEAQALSAAIFILIIILVLASSGIYLFERNAQPEDFGSIPAALWWAVATLTTVGYGDVIPVTAGGKVFGILIMIIGVGMVALPTGILASAFSEQVRQRRQEFEDLAENVLEDGAISLQEAREMEDARIKLGLTAEDAKKIFSRISKEEIRKNNICPNCKKLIFERRSK